MTRHAPVLLAAAAALVAGACAHAAAPSAPAEPFFDRLSTLCGRTFEGRVVTNDPVDADFARSRLVMTVRDCSAEEIRIPFHVGEDRSRTWIVTKIEGGTRLRLKHDHRHEDGTPDELTLYGGDSVDPGTASRQEFPADAYSIELFTRTGRSVSNTNVWALEVEPARLFAYELRRPNRFFRVEFDLTRPIG